MHQQSTESSSSVSDDVVEKAAQLSENIVKILTMRDNSPEGQDDIEETDSLSSLLHSSHDRRDGSLELLDMSLRKESGSSSSLPSIAMASIMEASVTSEFSNSIKQLAPAAFLMQELGRASYFSSEGHDRPPHSISALANAQLFHHCTEADRMFYDSDAVQAIHTKDIETLRTWHQHGRPLHTSNQFGETLLHIACRRGYLDVVLFLVFEANLSMWVYDEQGKTPLHLACHHHRHQHDHSSSQLLTKDQKPFLAELVNMLVIQRQDPELLFVADMRGCMPLDYAPRHTWSDWISFLESKEIVRDFMPRREIFFAPTAALASTHSVASGGSVSKSNISQPEIKDLPFLENIDLILKEYHESSKRRKKKKKKSKSSTRSLKASSRDDLLSPNSTYSASPASSSANLKSKITTAIIENMSLGSLDELTSVDEQTLVSRLQLQQRSSAKQTIARVSRNSKSKKSSTDVDTSPDLATINKRIEQLKLAQELKIRQIRAATAADIALEMERQAREALQIAERNVRATRMEYETIAKNIRFVEQGLGGGGGKEQHQQLLGDDGTESFAFDYTNGDWVSSPRLHASQSSSIANVAAAAKDPLDRSSHSIDEATMAFPLYLGPDYCV